MALYCARQDVYATGLPAEAFARPPRAVDSAAAFASGMLSLRSHGLATDAPIVLAVLSVSTLGATAAALPGGLSVGVSYYARPNGENLFALATAASPASAIPSFTDAGSGVFGIIVDHGAYLDAAILGASRIIDEFARAHSGAINAAILPLVCAFLAARIYTATHRVLVPEQKAGEEEAPSWVRGIVDKLFALWASGVTIKGATDSSPAVANMGPKAVRLRGRGFLSHNEREDLV